MSVCNCNFQIILTVCSRATFIRLDFNLAVSVLLSVPSASPPRPPAASSPRVPVCPHSAPLYAPSPLCRRPYRNVNYFIENARSVVLAKCAKANTSREPQQIRLDRIAFMTSARARAAHSRAHTHTRAIVDTESICAVAAASPNQTRLNVNAT